MLNKDNQRELCYVVKIDDITPIPGYDRVELAHVGGWTIIVGKGEFEVGNSAIYFEIDSKLPKVEPFTDNEFLVKKKFKVKTQKMCKSVSQGLLMSAESFGWKVQIEPLAGVRTEVIIDDEGKPHYPDDESRFLTNKLNVTYSVAEDNIRKRKSVDKYQKMIQRNKKKFSKQPYKWLLKKDWGKKLLFVFFGKKNDKGRIWPDWVKKTDEERVENMAWILNNKDPWIATEKIDGTSTTFTMKRGRFGKYEFLVCSRNVVFDKPDRQCFYDTNVYIEMATKYNIEEILEDMLDMHREWDWVTIQGETYGRGIQTNNYDLDDHRFAAFNLITSDRGRWNTIDMEQYLSLYNIPCVPIIDFGYILPDTVEELRKYSQSEKSVINGKIKEGIVFRSEDATKSFKCVDPEYLMQYH